MVFDCFAPAAAQPFGAPGGFGGGGDDESFLGLVLAWLRSPLVLAAIAGLSFYCVRGRRATSAEDFGDDDGDGDGVGERRSWQRSLLSAGAALFGRSRTGAMARSQLARNYGDADNVSRLRRSLDARSYATEHLRGASADRARSRLSPRGSSLVEQLRALRLRQHEGAEEDASDADEHGRMAASNAAAAFAGGGEEVRDDVGGASESD
jgi:hypothetical protein